MKTSSKKGYRSKPAQRRPQYEVTAAAGCAIFLMAGSGTALAQDQAAGADADDIEEVVVTGIRKSIQDSIGAKKNDSSIVEVVSAEDIGKLPDCLHRRIHRATARHRRAAHQRPRADAVDPRPGPRLHGHHVQRPRAGDDQRQPHGRVRPVPVGARHAGQDLQDARRRHGVPGHRGHHGHLDRASAVVLRQPPHVGDISREMNEQDANIPGPRRRRQPRQRHVHRPVHGQHAGRRVRCRLQQEPVPGADERALGLRRFADRRRPRRSSAATRAACSRRSTSAWASWAWSSTGRTTPCTCCSMRTTPTSRSCRPSSASNTAPSGRSPRRR